MDRRDSIKDTIICPECKYWNKKYWIEKFGTCNRCHAVLDKKAKFDYEMICKLRLWRKKKSQYASYKDNIKL